MFRVSGGEGEALNVKKHFRAKGDGITDDTEAFKNAISHLSDAGYLFVPPGTYKITDNLIIDTPVVIQGSGQLRSILNFSANKGIRLLTSAQFSTIEQIRYIGVPTAYPEWNSGTVYVPNDRVRNKLKPIGSTPPANSFPFDEIDYGTHLLCLTGGTSAQTQPAWSLRDGTKFTDGSVVWAVEDGSAISIHTSFVTIRNCQITFASDSGILVFGDGFEFIADGTIIEGCGIGFPGSSCIFTNGSDGQLTKTIGNALGNFNRGVGILDTGFFNSCHINNQAVVGRFPYVGSGQVAATLWLSNYHEACDTGVWMSTIQQWIAGWPNLDSGLVDPRNLGTVQGGDFFKGTLRMLEGNNPPFRRDIGGTYFEEWSRAGHGDALVDNWILTDPDDIGGHLSQRWLFQARETSREITAPSSVYGPAKWRFPQGYFLGKNISGRKQIWHTSLSHPPTVSDIAHTRQNLWNEGDVVWNESAQDNQPAYWKARRNGGWGGGRQFNGDNGGRTWKANTGNIAIGEGVEPSGSANGKVFKLLRFEELISGSWITQDRYSSVLSNTEPTWPTIIGNTVSETLDGTHRIIWQCFGNLGMDWTLGPIQSGTITSSV